MNKKNIISLICVAVVFFVLGFLCRMLVPIGDKNEKDMVKENKASSTDASVSSEDINARIREGYVEYYNGMTWVKVDTVDELQLQDPYEIAKKNLTEFEEEYLGKIEEGYQLVIQEDAEIISAPKVGEKKEGKSGSTNTGGNSSSVTETPSTPSTTETPSTPPATEAPPATETPTTTEAPPATEDSGGDGEDIGWSDDYL